MKTRCFLLALSLVASVIPARAGSIFEREAAWSWRAGSSEASSPVTAWRLAGFNDSEFTPAAAPFWYGDVLPGGTEITGMQNNYVCIFLRKTFTVEDASQVAGLRLGAIVDDGFVAWINGTEVLRVNMADPAGTAVSTNTLAQNAAEPVEFTTYVLPDPAGYLVTGANVIAVQVFQSSLGSSDLAFDAALESILVETTPPTVVSVTPAAGGTLNALTQITVGFSESVTGVESSDLRLNGAAAFSVVPLSSSAYVFSFPQPAYGTVLVTWDAVHGIADLALPPNAFDAGGPGASWQYELVDNTAPAVASVTPLAGSTIRSLTSIAVLFSEAVSGVDASDLLINGSPAANVMADAAERYTFEFLEPATGLVQVAWSAGHGIADLSAAANPFGGGAWEYVLDPTAETLLPYISEFMALNLNMAGNLADEDGEYSDWIEIHNPAGQPVNLEDWYLTDNAGNLDKWRFPATNLAGGDFLVVFASEKNRRRPGAPLHTNFRLSGGGEYLGLVKPDGAVASEYSPTYPPQAGNLSYGIGALTTNVVLISSNSAGRVRVPADGAGGLAWTQRDYDDSAWSASAGGVGYGAEDATAADYGAAVGPTQPVGYWRFSETSGSVAANGGSGAGLSGTYSGVALGTAGPRPPQFAGFEANNTAPTFNGSSGYVGVNNSLLNNRGAFTVAGWVRTAVTQAARTGLFGQNDCVEFGFISGTTLQCWTPGGGSVDAPYTLGVGTWFHVAAVGDGSNLRIYINGAVAATGGTPTASYGSSSSSFHIGGNGIFDATGNFFNGQLDEVVAYHRALSGAEVAALYQGGLQPAVVAVTPYVQTDIGVAMSNVNASVYLRVPFTIDDPARVAVLTLRMRYDDGFVAFINGVEAVRANAPATLAYNAAATAEHSPGSVEEYRLGGLVLQPGENVLAIQGLNRSAANEDFLAASELVATYVAASSLTPLYFSPATPGEENFGGVLYPGPAILEPAHVPNVPREDEDVVVTARVAGTFNAVASVVMRYRAMFELEVEVGMFDDGAHGDGLAFDGIYGATIPASAATNGQMIRWYIRATDVLGNPARWPLFESSAGSDSAEYLGTIVEPYNLTSTLPVIHLFAPPNILQPGPGATAQTGADSQAGARVSLFYDGEFYDNVHMQLRGNTTAGYSKKSHRIEFNREHAFRHAGAGYGAPDRPAPRVRKTSFVADYPDPTYMRQGLSFWLCDLIGSPSSYYYPVRLQLNGKFYQLANHNDVHSDDLLDRLGYDPAGALYNAAGTVVPGRFSTGGFEKKTRRWDSDDDYALLANSIAETLAVGMRQTNFFEHFDVPNALNYLVAARWAHENDDVWANMSLYHDNEGDNLWRIISFDMNLSWGAIYYEGGTPSVIEGVQATNDIHKAHPLYGSSQALALSGPSGVNGYNRVYDVVFQSPVLREMFLRRMRTMMDTYVKPPGTAAAELVMEQKVREWEALIAEEAELDRNYWGWPAKGGQCNFNPGIRLGAGVEAMINEFIVKRRQHFYGKHSVTNTALAIGIGKANNAGIPLSQAESVFIDIAGLEFNPASGNQEQEYIVLANSNPDAVDISGWSLSGAVRFTFAPGTVIPSNRQLYVSPNVVAFRARTTGPRGGQGHFVVGPYDGQLSARGETILLADQNARLVASHTYPGDPSLPQQHLRITELMYSPRPLAGSLTDPQLFEYVKLKNIGGVALDLAGVRFTNGIYFDFTGSAVPTLAPGEVVVVVKDAAAFAARYGTSLNVAGVYTGSLDNGGERIRLLDATGEEILDFEYNNSWYPITDGLGFSLMVVDEQAEPDAWGRKSQWRSSGYLDGSPGDPVPAFPVIAAILVNEVLTHTDLPDVDAVELYNPTAEPVSLEGWFVTDDFDTPRKYRIPAGVVIPGGGYVVFTEAQFNPTPGAGTSFAFGSGGEEVYLFSGDASTNLTGYVHGFEFGAAATGVSFGRHLTSTGAEHFVAQSAVTLGDENAGPRVGPVLITEIMYHPPDELVDGVLQNNSRDEYIELHNAGAVAVPLYDTNVVNNTWRFKDAVRYAFPAGTSLPAGGYLLVVDFDPADAVALGEFRARNGVPAGVPVFGPWDGELANLSESVELARPDTPDAAGAEPPWILVERVEYSDSAPWAGAADGIGPSLQRVANTAYGDDPSSWVAALPSPGAAFGGGEIPVITTHPESQTALELATVEFTVAVTGAGPFSYRWRFNGAILPGETGPVLAVGPLELSDQGEYSVAVLNPAGAVVSSNATLTVLRLPVITAHPQNFSVTPGSAVNFSVSAIGTGPLAYQWRRNGVDVAGANGATLALANAQFDVNDGYYTVVVTDDIGARESEPGLLTVRTRPTITQQLQISPSAALLDGRTFSFTISASGSWPMGFRFRAPSDQYFSIITANSNHNTVTLVVDNAKAALHQGNWDVGITNSGGQALSTRIAVTVGPAAPFFALDPVGHTVAAGATLLLESEARGTDPIGYQWYFNGSTPIANATNAGLELANVQAADAGQYVAVASNHLGMATSLVAQVTLASGPSIVTSPADQNVTPCEPATFTATAEGAAPLMYQWFFNGTQLLAGQTAATLTLASPRLADEGDYAVVVSNPGGSVTSAVATLTLVLGDCDADGISDLWEMTYGLNPADPGDRDLDGDNDGRSNWEESVSGTDPNSAASVLEVNLAAGALGGAVLEFTAQPGISYSVLYRAQLGTGSWLSLTNIPPQGAAAVIEVTDPGAGAQTRFYRVVTPMQPQ